MLDIEYLLRVPLYEKLYWYNSEETLRDIRLATMYNIMFANEQYEPTLYEAEIMRLSPQSCLKLFIYE